MQMRRAAVLFVLLGVFAGHVATASADGRRSAPTWVQQTGAGPSGRLGASMAYDEATEQTVLFGGLDFGGAVTFPSDTWTWSGRRWSQQTPPTNPGGRYGSAMVYDAALRRVLLFGGSTATGALDPALWAWNGARWTLVPTTGGPDGRFMPAMSYDSSTHQVVVFGGSDGTAILNDTWTWDGATWTQQHPLTSPPARYAAGMTFDTSSGRTVLFGGELPTAYAADTWLWDGATWTQAHPTTSPSPRNSALAYDAATREVVMFSGVGAPADTWTWDGGAWTQQNPAPSPPARGEGALAYDAEHGSVVLFGGFTGVNLGDTWLYRAPDR